ncbi:hypothetical protein [Deinococcus ruber]|uniref:Uncharacterized protein n=1 Tax=Deinococcus ruber TaxID=1848197 RepID=A0A918CQM0_9DEIO|nr:hypothetical protein [Deinococcus ruber]GGR33782.1 hypothetical protein GCM10008957_49950 [Deinococcus ruber]
MTHADQPVPQNHILITPAEVIAELNERFPNDPASGEWDTLYRHVVEGGLAMCKVCRRAEIELEEPCVPR